MSTVYSFTRYLAAKKTVDDRAINRTVWQALRRALPPHSPENPLKILEIGCGIGSMIQRSLTWDLFQAADYTAIDSLPENILTARDGLQAWAQDNAYRALPQPDGSILLYGTASQARLRLEAIDLFDFIARQAGRTSYDLIGAHAFLDLMDIPAALPQIFRLLRPGGLFHFTLNFDGATIFEPPVDPELDARIERLYHQTMDERLADGKPSGDSRAGRRLYHHLRACGAEVLAAGASDWVTLPSPSGGYPDDEAYFLEFILHFFEESLAGRPELTTGELTGWLAARRKQIEGGELMYIAHQLDFAGRLPG
jgi:SAM-dependent methyltransferase